MKKQLKKSTLPLLAILLCLCWAVSSSAQTTILVKYYDGSEQLYSIAPSGKLYFQNQQLQVVTSEAVTAASIPVSIIRKITFSFSVVPLKIVLFTLENKKAAVALYWKTANEMNAVSFIIERSTDGIHYENIGQTAAVNNTGTNSYSYSDASPLTGVTYYRVKAVDANGNMQYTTILSVNRAAGSSIMLVPNPATDHFRINSSSTEKMAVKIYSSAGQLMITGSYYSGESIAVSTLTPGLYIVLVNGFPYKLIRQ